MKQKKRKRKEKKKMKKEKEKKEKEAKQKCLETKALLEEKLKKMGELYDAKFKEAKELENEARKKLKSGDKIGAKRCLVKKKKLLQITENLNNQMMIMDDQLIALDNAANIGAIMTTIKNANNALKNNQVSVEELQNEGEKIKEHKDNIGELNIVIEDYNNENDDEDDLADELEKCANELKEEAKLPSANKEDLNDKGKIKNLDDELNLMSL